MSTSSRPPDAARTRAPRPPLPTNGDPPRRPRGRPPLATRDDVIEQIRAAAQSGELFRVHLMQPALYARARRIFGTWSEALQASGIDHGSIVQQARRRAVESRRVRRATRSA